jgi:vacuolar protein sorting-associated protein 53
MLLDKYALTRDFLNLLSLSPAASSHGPSTSFIKRVNQSMDRLNPLLKTLQVRPAPAEGLVQAYLIHIGDKSEANFKKILELKGVRKQDQPHLVELFQIHRDSPRSGSGELVQNSPLLTPLVIGSGESKGGIAALGPAIASGVYPPGLSARNASAFGEKLFSAARDGVERIGSGAGTPNPSGGASSAHAREGSVERATDGETKTSMNENLKNIGKFFRRDISGFGGRFGGRGGASANDTVR